MAITRRQIVIGGLIAGAGAAIGFASSYKPQKPKRVKISPELKLARTDMILQTYLSHQKVADLSKLRGGRVFILEQLAHNPDLLDPYLTKGGQYLSYKEQILREAKRGNTALTIALGSTDPKIHSKTPIIVIFPSRYVSLISGTPAEKNTFDSLIYHEVEVHGSDFHPDSKFMRLYKKMLVTLRQNHAATNAIMEDAKEFGAYLLELDRLINQFDYLENPQVITSQRKHNLENNLAVSTMTLLELFKTVPDVKHIPGYKQVIDDLKDYTFSRLDSVSEKTREYLRQLLRQEGNDWQGPIPF